MGIHRGNYLLHPFLATRQLQWRQRPLSLSHSLTLTLSLYTHARQLLTTKMQQQHFMFALSHIYTHMTFGLFAHMAPRCPQEHIYICVPSNRLGGTSPGLRSSGSPKLPIRRDLFPNTIYHPQFVDKQNKLIRSLRYALSIYSYDAY